jgi:hypothetical protein
VGSGIPLFKNPSEAFSLSTSYAAAGTGYSGEYNMSDGLDFRASRVWGTDRISNQFQPASTSMIALIAY